MAQQKHSSTPEAEKNGRLPEPAADDPFADLSRLRLSQDFAAAAEVKAVITTVPVRKPHKQEFIRTRPGADWRFETGCFEDKESREVYLVDASLWSTMPGEITPTALVVSMSRNSPVPFLWPLKLPGPDGRGNRWHESAMEAAKLAESQWVRVVADMAGGCYVPHVAQGDLPEPDWPEETLTDLLRLAFRDRFIRQMDHPVLRRLRGEA